MALREKEVRGTRCQQTWFVICFTSDQKLPGPLNPISSLYFSSVQQQTGLFTHFWCTQVFRCLCCRRVKECSYNRREESLFYALFATSVWWHPSGKHRRPSSTCCAPRRDWAGDALSFHFLSSPRCLLLCCHRFPNSWPSCFTHPEINLPPKCQKCSVRHARSVPNESVFLLLSN